MDGRVDLEAVHVERGELVGAEVAGGEGDDEPLRQIVGGQALGGGVEDGDGDAAEERLHGGKEQGGGPGMVGVEGSRLEGIGHGRRERGAGQE